MSVEKNIVTIIENVLSIQDYGLKEDSSLLGEIAEFDSQAVLTVMTEIEDHFGIYFDDEEISAEIFESVKTLSDFVKQKL